MVSIGNLVVGGFWVAAAVKVFDNTWIAFQSTYSKFPTAGASGAIDPTVPTLPGPGKPIPKGTPGAGGTPLEPGGVPAGPQIKAPPAKLVTPLIRAIRAKNKAMAKWWYHQMIKWANAPAQTKRGWGTNQLGAWAMSQPWATDFQKLVHPSPGGSGWVISQ